MKTCTTLGVDVVSTVWFENELNPNGAYEEFHYFNLGRITCEGSLFRATLPAVGPCADGHSDKGPRTTVLTRSSVEPVPQFQSFPLIPANMIASALANVPIARRHRFLF